CLLYYRGPIRWTFGAALVGAILTLDLLLLFLAFRRIDFATAVALHNAGPILVIIFAPWITGDQFRPGGLVLACIGFAAVAVLCGVKLAAASTATLAGVTYALLSAGTLAASMLVQRHLMKRGDDFRGTVLQYNITLTAACVLLAIAWPYTMDGAAYVDLDVKPFEIAGAALAGVITQGLAMLLFNSAARRLSSEAMARLSLLGPMFTVIIGALLYAEHPTTLQLVALGTIMAVSYVARPDASESNPAAGMPARGRTAQG
ncbi:MAG TPA: DMT family transporter, partial [Povalibacter sp.]|nr:DMT family transporter [Povalibacter sp.]